MMARYTVKTKRGSVTWHDRWLLMGLCLSLALPLAVNARLIHNTEPLTTLTSDLAQDRHMRLLVNYYDVAVGGVSDADFVVSFAPSGKPEITTSVKGNRYNKVPNARVYAA